MQVEDEGHHHEHNNKPDVVLTDVKEEKEHNRETHIMIRSKSDAIIAKPNIREIEQPKDIEMEDVSGLKCRTIDYTAKNSHHEIKTRRSKRSASKHHKRKIILEYTRSTHEFKVTVISNTAKPSKNKLKLNKTQALKIEQNYILPKKIEEVPIEKKPKEDPKKSKQKKSSVSKQTPKKHVSPKTKSSVKSLKVKPKPNTFQTKETKETKEPKESKETKESKVKEVKESKYSLKLRSKKSEERKEKSDTNHSTKRVLLKTIIVKDQKSEKMSVTKESKSSKISPRTRSQKKQVKMKFDRSNSKRKVISKLVESIK
jgi:hypothetical protein